MKSQVLQFAKGLIILIALSAIFLGTAYSQGNNWKITGNNNIDDSTNFVGTTNAKDLNLGTNDTVRFKIKKDGDVVIKNDLNVKGNVTTVGYLVVDSIHVLTSAKIGEGSINLNSPNPDDISTTSGDIYFGRDPGNFFDVKIGIGINQTFQSILDKLHLNDDTPTDVYTRYTNGITGSLVGDGFQVGVYRSGEADLRNLENSPMRFFTNDKLRVHINQDILGLEGFIGVNSADPPFKFSIDVTPTGAVAGADGGILASGTLLSGAIVPAGLTTARMIWYPRKAAFRAGLAAVEWDDVNIGQFSVAFGTGNIAFGQASFAGGLDNIASGNFSAAFGSGNIASGQASFAVGVNNIASGSLASVFGEACEATGVDAFAAGHYSYAHGSESFSFGRDVETGAASEFTFVFGRGIAPGLALLNDVDNSLMVGFEHTLPTFIVIGTPVPGTFGRVGIATKTPAERLHVAGTDGFIRTDPLATPPAVPPVITTNDGVVVADVDGTLRTKINFTGNANDALLGDGTFGPGVPDNDWTGAGSGQMYAGSLTDGVSIGLTNAGNAKFRVFNNQVRFGINVRTDAAAVVPTGPPTSISGVVFNGTGPNTGVVGGAFSSAVNSQNAGVSGQAIASGNIANTGVSGSSSGASRQNIGVRADAFGATINYGIFSFAAGGGTNYAGYFLGNVHITGTLTGGSDIMLKDNVQDIEDAIDIITQLQPKTFIYKTQTFPYLGLAEGLRYGLIAQDVQNVLPSINDTAIYPAQYDSLGNQTSPEVEYLSTDYNALIPILIQGMKEQQNEIDSMKAVMSLCCNQNNFKTGGGNNGGNEGGEIGEINAPIYEKLASKGVILYDAVPNPFQGEVSIGFFIPEHIINAEIVFFDNFGRTLKTVQVNQRGNGTVIIDASDLASGLYTYGIIADGQAIDTKKMVRSK